MALAKSLVCQIRACMADATNHPLMAEIPLSSFLSVLSEAISTAMHTKIRIEWLVGGLILFVVAILIARHDMWRNPVEKGSDDSQGGQVDEIKATDSRRQERSELRSTDASAVDRRAASLLAVGEGEVAMIGLSGNQFESLFGMLTPTFQPLLPSLVNVYSRQDVEAAIRALLAEGDELKATLANADMAKLAGSGVTVETAVLSEDQSGSDLKMIIDADEGVHHTVWTLERNGVLVVRSLADPREAILIVGPAL